MKTSRIVLCVLLAAGSLSAVSADDPPDLAKLLKERVEVARTGMEAADAMFLAGRLTFDQVTVWSRRLVDAELAVAKNKRERVAALEEFVKRAKAHEDIAMARFRAGQASNLDVTEMKYNRIEAEVQLEKARKEGAGK